MPRPPRIQQEEYPYHVTTRTNGRKWLFKKWCYKIIIAVLHEAIEKYGAKVEHFKMMHNHYHMKICTPKQNISQIMWFINNQISKRINKRLGKSGHLWGSRFHATIIDNDNYALRCVKYIYTNGVRAGLCKRVSEDKQLSSFEFYARGKQLEFCVSEDTVFLMLGSDKSERERNFRKLVDEPLEGKDLVEIRKRLKKMFYGSKDFIQRMNRKYLD